MREKNSHQKKAPNTDTFHTVVIVGLFLLNNLANKYDKNSVGLYREMDLPYSKISMVIGQIKYAKNSTNYLRKTDYL